MNVKYISLISSLLLSAVCVNLSNAAQAPELILHNGAVYTLDERQAWAEAVAVFAGKITAVGNNTSLLALADKDTQLIDLRGRMLMPGINDAHIHPLMGGMKELYECNFPFTADPEQIRKTIKACVEDPDSGDWIVGGQWDSGFFENYPLPSPRKFLDEISKDKYVFLSDDASHNAWLNTKALEYFSVKADSVAPKGGAIVREPGSLIPNGILLETMAVSLERKLPVRTQERAIKAIQHVQDLLLSYGVTAIKEARTPDIGLAAYQELEQKGKLKINIATSLQTPYGARTQPLNMDDYVNKRNKYQSKHVHTAFVKIFMDGVPTPSRTAKMLAPYIADEKHGAHYTGTMHLTEEEMTQELVALDKAGFTVKIHTAGDGSVNTLLNAIAQVRSINGNSDRMYELAHAGYIQEADIPRFVAMNVAPDFSPYLWHPSSIIRAVISAVGERGNYYWPTKDLLNSDATIIAGSDWPAAVPSPNPWVGIEAMVTRRDPYNNVTGSLWPEQAVSLQQALKIFTMNGAQAMRLEDRIGSIEAGKDANLIVLEKNVFKISEDDIADTQVQLVLFEGEIVFTSGK